MTWERLFRELDHEWEGAVDAQLQAEVAERTRAELGRLMLLERLRGSVGHRLRLGTVAGWVTGELVRVAADCLLLERGSVELLVPVAAVSDVEGLGQRSVPDDQVGEVQRRLGMASLLRRVARDRAAVTVVRAATPDLHGTPVLVGADFLELAVHDRGEAARARTVSTRLVVPFAAISVVRREP